MQDDNNERPVIPSLEKLKAEFLYRAQNAPTEEERAHWRHMLYKCKGVEDELMEQLEEINKRTYTLSELEYFARTGRLPHWDEEDEDDEDEFDDDELDYDEDDEQ
jgi:hypothetical protein